MGFIVRFANAEKVRKKIDACRECGMKIEDNFVLGVTKAFYDETVALVCTKQAHGTRKMEYNDDFWAEQDVTTNRSA